MQNIEHLQPAKRACDEKRRIELRWRMEGADEGRPVEEREERGEMTWNPNKTLRTGHSQASIGRQSSARMDGQLIIPSLKTERIELSERSVVWRVRVGSSTEFCGKERLG